MTFRHFRPAFPTDQSLYEQKELTPTTYEELQKLRELPKYNLFQKFIAIIYFLIFGVIKILGALTVVLVGGSSFVGLCTIWRAFGENPSFKMFLRKYYICIARIFIFFCGFVKINFHGNINKEARFHVSNHVSFFDGWIFMSLSPRALARKEFFTKPILNYHLYIFDSIAVDRSQATGVTQKLIDSALDMTKNHIMVMPEGATTDGNYMFRFRLGAFLSDLPVQCVAIRYSIWGCSSKTHHISFVHNYPKHILHFFGIPAITADVYYLDTISLKTEGNNEPRQLADIAGLKIANYLGVKMIDKTNKVLFEKKEN